jgi:hypothetical protein
MKRPAASAPSTPSTAKRQKLQNVSDEVIDQLSIDLNPVSDSNQLHNMYDTTSPTRVAWLKKLHKDPSLDLGIITKVVSKFRHVKTDVSLVSPFCFSNYL